MPPNIVVWKLYQAVNRQPLIVEDMNRYLKDSADCSISYMTLTHDEKLVGLLITMLKDPNKVIILTTKMTSFIRSSWAHTIAKGSVIRLILPLNMYLQQNYYFHLSKYVRI